MSGHTKEPWEAVTPCPGECCWHVRPVGSEDPFDVVNHPEMSRDDAHRIVACVNACAGLTTENLESFAGPLILATSMSQWLRYCDLKDSLAELLEALPKTADGLPIVPGITVYCIAGEHVDERKVLGPYGKLALLTTEPARHGAGTGQCHRLANSVYSTFEAAKAAIAKSEAA